MPEIVAAAGRKAAALSTHDNQAIYEHAMNTATEVLEALGLDRFSADEKMVAFNIVWFAIRKAFVDGAAVHHADRKTGSQAGADAKRKKTSDRYAAVLAEFDAIHTRHPFAPGSEVVAEVANRCKVSKSTVRRALTERDLGHIK
jgi:hypothetical protein